MKNYESPIRLLETTVDQLKQQIDAQTNEAIYRAIVSVGVSVNREDLIRALQYDREQYEKGYADGLMAGVEVVRCKDCVYNENGSCTKVKIMMRKFIDPTIIVRTEKGDYRNE